MGNHIHLLVDAADSASLSRAMKGLAVRLARGLNAMMGDGGKVVGDRYHLRVLKTPTEVRHDRHYIRHNFRQHEAQLGRVIGAGFVDPFSSDGDFASLVCEAVCWLLTEEGSRRSTGSVARRRREGRAVQIELINADG
jgi:tRNA threonylcarbamoyladenosine modification (KEOPS) complex  Pcc1 subunit